MNDIFFSNVSKYYNNIANNKFLAINNVSFNINHGEKVALLGPNGSGKSTIMKILSGIITNDAGIVNVLGFTPNQRQNAFLHKFGLLAGQKSHLWWDLPPIDSFYLAKAVYNIDDKSFKKRLNLMVDTLNISHLIHKQTRKLSLGERMKMEIIYILLHMPQIIFLDEPTIGLDYKAQVSITEMLNNIHKEYATTILLTSHYLKDIEDVCDRVIILKSGSKIYDNSLPSLKSSYGIFYKIKFTSNANIMSANLSQGINIIESDGAKHIVRVDKKSINTFLDYLSKVKVSEISIEEPTIIEALDSLYAGE